ncbi:MAG: ferrous iron transporter B [Dehalococcoidia bacterium]|nr:ferrous iron transporter B [Dehalococcoidia bacterium]
MKILLVGNPNVGKQALFSRLAEVKATTSDYPGTAVAIPTSHMKLGDQKVEIIDVPGSYTLDPTSKEEAVAARIIKDGDLIINVVNATNLERNLFLTLQLLETGIPMIVALNMWDDTKHRGLHIDYQKLEDLLGVPVTPTVAVTGEGIKELVSRIPQAKALRTPTQTKDQQWATVGGIVGQVQTVTHRHHTWLEHLGDNSIKPFPGIPIALTVLLCSFIIIRFIGEGLIGFVFDPFFDNLWAPLMTRLSDALGSEGFLHDVLVGRLIEGEVNFKDSLGMLTTGLYIPFGVVLPYVFAFYLILGVLEDVGYLPRVAVLLDNLMHRIGVHGYAIIPTLLGLGCHVPAILATRVLESERERFIVATLISIGIPCAALQAMIIGTVGDYGLQYVAITYGVLLLVWIVLGLILKLTIKGFTPELLIEIPPYRVPPLNVVASKLQARIVDFLQEAVPLVMAGIFVITVLEALHVFQYIANVAEPVVSGLFGLPRDASAPLIIGALRKDMAVGMLNGLDLTAGQLVIGCLMLSMIFPCLATFVVMGRELGVRRLLLATGIMLATSIVVGSLLNLVL